MWLLVKLWNWDHYEIAAYCSTHFLADSELEVISKAPSTGRLEGKIEDGLFQPLKKELKNSEFL